MAMTDKICRGSPIGEAHNQGLWGARGSPRRPSAAGLARHDEMRLEKKEWLRTEPGDRSPRPSRAAGPPQSPRLFQSKSAWDLKDDSQGMATPRFSPRQRAGAGSAGPKSLTRGKSESWLTARVDCGSPRGTLRSLRDTLCDRAHMDDAWDQPAFGKATADRRGDPEQARSPRASSPTFRTSESWMDYSAPIELRKEEVIKPELTMPSSNFSSGFRCRHSGRVSGTSGNWLEHDPGAESPAEPTLLHNSENFIPSKGKKVGIAREQDSAKRRIRLDASEPMPAPATQRRCDFPTGPQAARHQEQLGRVDTARGDKAVTADLVAVQHRSSPELVASLNPEVPRQGTAPPPRKILVGAELVDWSFNGKRRVQACRGETAQSCARRASPRDHRNSDAVREHLYTPQPASREPLMPGVRPPPVVYHTHCVYTTGASCLPSTMPKDAAYLQTGTNVSRYSPRAPGTFSPNVLRAPVASTRVQL